VRQFSEVLGKEVCLSKVDGRPCGGVLRLGELFGLVSEARSWVGALRNRSCQVSRKPNCSAGFSRL